MTYKVYKYGEPELRIKSQPVERIDDAIRELAADMLAAMHRNNGIGLAAEQVGRAESICVIDIPPGVDGEQAGTSSRGEITMPLVLINPRIIKAQGEQTEPEGCLSFPDVFVPVKRAAEVDVTFTNLDEEEESVHAAGLLARAVQHELDHLEGVLLVDRMSPVQKVSVAGKLKRIKRGAAA